MTEYFCQFCNYKTKIKTHFIKHLSTNKHKRNIGNEEDDFMNEKKIYYWTLKNPQFHR